MASSPRVPLSDVSLSLGRVDILDYARFSAAMAVVLYHYTYWGIISNHISTVALMPQVAVISRYGYLEVEFFS